MPIARKFLDWNAPALPAVVADLRDRYTIDGHCDLSGVIAVFPGRQAARRFLELLTLHSEGEAQPPTMITVGQLPEFLYEPKRPFATSLTQRLSWAEALKSLPRDRLEIVVAQPPTEHDVDAWMSLGELLSAQHRELAADELDFSSVTARGALLDGFNELARWKTLAEVQESYLRLLDSFDLWDQQTARLVAIEKQECQLEQDLVLVGTVDMNRTLRKMLQQVADRVTAYVHAPRELEQAFDEFGCLRPETWSDLPIELTREQVRVVEGPADQAEEVLRVLSSFDGRYALEDVTVCVPDERIVPHVRRLLEQSEIPTHWVIERQLPETEPYRLLAAVADFLETHRSDRFAALIRHPDMSAWLNRKRLPAEWLTEWDSYFGSCLQRNTDGLIEQSMGSHTARRLVQSIDRLLNPLTRDSRPLSSWAEPLTDLLTKIYGHREFDLDVVSDAVIVQACVQIVNACTQHTLLPERLNPVVDAVQAIQLTLEEIQGELIASPIRGEAVQLFGWLEMALDDAPAAIVTSFNEGVVPSAQNHDLFLPNKLRTHLGIEDNARRYARDAYALSVLLHAREHVSLVVAKQDVQGDPLAPSRLLFASDPQTIARRVLTFYAPSPEESIEMPHSARGGPQADGLSGFRIPRPLPRTSPPRSFRVTEFRDYIASPYRYYLKHVLRLQGITDDLDELDAAAFGTLIHEVLNRFGESPLRDSRNPVELREALAAELDQVVAEYYGSDPLYPVLIQVEQARYRLASFAEWQATWRQAGWELRYTELDADPPVEFPLELETLLHEQTNVGGGGLSVPLRGRIDRIDYHPELGQWAILDYKTGDQAKDPDKAHRNSQGEWQDLQLPLYRHLVRNVGIQGDVKLGYIALPRDSKEVGVKWAEWPQEVLDNADRFCRQLVRQILDEEFWIEVAGPPQYGSEFAAICQDGVFGNEIIV